jgi:hypothetical protein
MSSRSPGVHHVAGTLRSDCELFRTSRPSWCLNVTEVDLPLVGAVR